jgi:hypothetical protein
MSPRNSAGDGAGARTSAEGTPVAVDVSPDRRARVALAAFLGGPVTALTHFMLVYLVVEAGCTGDGPGLRSFDPPVPDVVPLVATALAGAACFGFAAWNRSRWRGRRLDETDGPSDRSDDLEAPDPGGSLALAGLLLALLSFVAVLLVGLPALFLPAC